MEKTRRLSWDNQALKNLEKALKWISETSIQQAEHVEQAILIPLQSYARILSDILQINIKSNNTGNYRAVETHSFRISYHHSKDEIRILRFRHVKQSPKAH